MFDFDGVIVDGRVEYWNSSRKALLELLKEKSTVPRLPKNVPSAFQQLRPWVKNGWEMVLITAELTRHESPLVTAGVKNFANNYKINCKKALNEWGWNPDQLQNVLDRVRKETININKDKWLKSHVAFPGLQKRINQLVTVEKIDFAVLTTKSTQFTAELLNYLNLHPKLLYGHEAGEKTDLLRQMSKNHTIAGFLEDRRATLETVLKTPDLNSIPLYLASWGYLKPDDTKDLPSNIHLLKPENLMSPLAKWS